MAIVRPFGGTSPRLHESVMLIGDVTIVGDVEIGEGSSVWFGSVVRGDVNSVRIGARTNVQDCCVIHVRRNGPPTVVGDEVTLGHRVALHGCTVKDRSLIGIGALVMDGAVVGEDCLVGAGALVPPGMVVPPGMLVLGSPAAVKRPLAPEELASLRDSATRYAGYAERYRREGWPSR